MVHHRRGLRLWVLDPEEDPAALSKLHASRSAEQLRESFDRRKAEPEARDLDPRRSHVKLQTSTELPAEMLPDSDTPLETG